MKTIEQVLENVTAGGKWDSEIRWLEAKQKQLCYFSQYGGAEDAAYAARAASSFPALVKALQALLADGHRRDQARDALAEALKD